MSMKYRKSLTAMLGHLQDRMKQATVNIAEPIPEDLVACEALLDKLSNIRSKIDQSLQRIATKDDEYRAMLNELDPEDDKTKGENTEYMDYMSKTDGIQAVTFAADDAVCDLGTRITSVQRKIESLHTPPPDVAPQPTARSSTIISDPPMIKQPKLPEFNGDVYRWRQFWELYDAHIHSRSDWSKIAKFTYLLDLLKGKAAEAIDGLPITSDHYDTAITILQEKYHRSDERLLASLYSDLKTLPGCGNRNSEKRKTYEACEKIFRQLEGLSQNLDHNQSLSLDVLSKFPSSMVMDLSRHYHVGVHSKLSDLRRGLLKCLNESEELSETVSELQNISTSSGQRRETTPNFANITAESNHVSSSYPVSSALVTLPRSHGITAPGRNPSNEPTNQGAFRPCYFCNGPHQNADCPRYSTAQARRDRLMEVQRCFKCGFRGHIARACQRQIRCGFCNEINRHFSAICPREYPEPHQSSQRSNNRNSEERPRNFRNARNPVARRSQTYLVQEAEDSDTHAETESTEDRPTSRGNTQSKQPGNLCTAAFMSSQRKTTALFMTAKVLVENMETGSHCVARIALDTLSNKTYILESIASRLSLTTSPDDNLYVSVFGASQTLSVPTTEVSFGIILPDGTTKPITANTTPLISNGNALPDSLPESTLRHLRTMKSELADDIDDPQGSIDILIGADYVWDFITGCKKSTKCGIYLIPSIVGYLLAGCVETTAQTTVLRNKTSAPPVMICLTHTYRAFQSALGLATISEASYALPKKGPDISELWNLESIGITDDPVKTDDDEAAQQFAKTVYYENGRYQVQLPWIEKQKNELPKNFELSLGRFRTLHRRFLKEPDLKEKYQDVINLQLERGIIERVPPQEVECSKNVVHYLPHHPVLTPQKSTTKVRIVYDASSKVRRTVPSLNECLYRGPVILPNLCQILLRFRSHRFAVVADLEKAFLQVSLQPSQRDAVRFLWYDDSEKLQVDGNLAAFRFSRVPFGIISSPFLLGATIQHHLASSSLSIGEKLAQDMYVDNAITGVATESSVIEIYHASKQLFAEAGMNLQEFCSNSAKFMQQVPEVDKVKQTDIKVLGLQWDSAGDDSLRVATTNWKKFSHCQTKRDILKATASVFDPMGWFQPVTVLGKWFMKAIWDKQLEWDQPLPPDMTEQWRQYHASMTILFSCRIPRYFGPYDDSSSIIVFSDASAKGYGCVVYIRNTTDMQQYSVHLAYSRTRLAPTAKVTLPRLELMGLVIGVRAATFVREALCMSTKNKLHCFVDSKCVLHWVKSKKLLSRFVTNRVTPIRQTENCEFHYVSSEENPADLCTRGASASELLSSSWWDGPQWLRLHESHWPATDITSFTDEDLQLIESEVRYAPVIHTMATLNTKHDETSLTPEFAGIEIRRMSSLLKLLHVTILCLKLLKTMVCNHLPTDVRIASNLNQLFDQVSDVNTFQPSDYRIATIAWVRATQELHFPDVIESLRENKKHQLITQLGLSMDDEGILRSYSRYDNVELPEEAKYPILLPKKSIFTEMVVRDIHLRLIHAGPDDTLNKVRKQYWIPQGKQMVKSLVKHCKACLKSKGPPYALPRMPSWPSERVSRSAPFQFTGVDYLGPIKIRLNAVDTNKSKPNQPYVVNAICKTWVCLFTCLATRLVHLEYVLDCTALEFMHCLSRFISRRGVPEQVLSDNAPQFNVVGNLWEREWCAVMTDPSVTCYCSQRGITWRFTIELAPWQGGAYERLVGLVKTSLRSAIGRRLLSWSEFITLITEVEAIVNSRPITAVSSDVQSEHTALRPIDFLTERPVIPVTSTNPVNIREIPGDSAKHLARYWAQKQRHLEKVWAKWYDDYLSSLRSKGNPHHHQHRAAVQEVPAEGDIVILREEKVPRGMWKLVRVNKVIKSQDGHIRAVEVRLPITRILVRRTLNHLYPLEVHATSDKQHDTESIHHILNTDTQTILPDNDSESQQPTPTPSVEDESFWGFTPEEIQRASDALNEFPDVDDEYPLQSQGDHVLSCITVPQRMICEHQIIQGRANLSACIQH